MEESLRENSQKSQQTLARKMAEGNTYKDFLLNQLNDVHEEIGEFTQGPFFEKLYKEHLDDGEFENTTKKKNLILRIDIELKVFYIHRILN